MRKKKSEKNYFEWTKNIVGFSSSLDEREKINRKKKTMQKLILQEHFYFLQLISKKVLQEKKILE